MIIYNVIGNVDMVGKCEFKLKQTIAIQENRATIIDHNVDFITIIEHE